MTELVPLGEICEINPRSQRGLSPDLLCSFVPMEYVDDVSGAIMRKRTRKVAEVQTGYTAFSEGDILFAKITPCMENGKCAIARNLTNGVGYGSTEFHVIRSGNRSIAEWVYYFLRQEKVRHQAKQGMTGSAGQKRVPALVVEELSIPLPPLAEQQRLAALLEKADRLRQSRRYAQTLSDAFLQSVFLQMFGDPASNSLWETDSLESQLAHIDSGWSPVCDESPAEASEWGVLKLSAVTSGQYLASENKRLPSHETPRTHLEVVKGDVLLTRKNTFELVAACALVNETRPKLMLSDTIFRFAFKENARLIPSYIWGLFSEKQFRKQVQSLASGSAGSMPNISKEKLLELRIPVPPLEKQEEFARVVRRYERLRAQQAEATRQAEHLFQSLLAQIFAPGK